MARKVKKLVEESFVLDNGTPLTFTLKNVKDYPKMSDETSCFTATLVVNYNDKDYEYECSNDGKGGQTDIRPSSNDAGERKQARVILDEVNTLLGQFKNLPFIDFMKTMGYPLYDTPMLSIYDEVDNLHSMCD